MLFSRDGQGPYMAMYGPLTRLALQLEFQEIEYGLVILAVDFLVQFTRFSQKPFLAWENRCILAFKAGELFSHWVLQESTKVRQVFKQEDSSPLLTNMYLIYNLNVSMEEFFDVHRLDRPEIIWLEFFSGIPRLGDFPVGAFWVRLLRELSRSSEFSS